MQTTDITKGQLQAMSEREFLAYLQQYYRLSQYPNFETWFFALDRLIYISKKVLNET